MNTTLAIILGAVIWMTIVTIVDLATNENENIVIPLAAGIWLVILGLGSRAVYYLRRLYAQKRYVYYQVFGKLPAEVKGTYDGWLSNYYMDERAAAHFKNILGKEDTPVDYCIRAWRSGKEIKTIPQRSEILTEKQILAMNVPGFTADYLKHFFE